MREIVTIVKALIFEPKIDLDYYVTTAILGATKKEQLVETIKSIEVISKLTPEVNEKIEKIMGTKPILPAF